MLSFVSKRGVATVREDRRQVSLHVLLVPLTTSWIPRYSTGFDCEFGLEYSVTASALSDFTTNSQLGFQLL